MTSPLTDKLGHIIAELKEEVSRVVKVRSEELSELLALERSLVGAPAVRTAAKKAAPQLKSVKTGARRGRKRSENSVASRVLAIINSDGVARGPSDVLKELGDKTDIRVVTTTLANLAREGLIERPSRGVYKRASRAAARAA